MCIQALNWNATNAFLAVVKQHRDLPNHNVAAAMRARYSDTMYNNRSYSPERPYSPYQYQSSQDTPLSLLSDRLSRSGNSSPRPSSRTGLRRGRFSHATTQQSFNSDGNSYSNNNDDSRPYSSSGYNNDQGLSSSSGYNDKSGSYSSSGYNNDSEPYNSSGYSNPSGRDGYSGYNYDSERNEHSGYSSGTTKTSYSGYSGNSGRVGYSGYNNNSAQNGYSGYSNNSAQSGYSGYNDNSAQNGYSGHNNNSAQSGGYSGYNDGPAQSGYSGYNNDSRQNSYSGYGSYPTRKNHSDYPLYNGSSSYDESPKYDSYAKYTSDPYLRPSNPQSDAGLYYGSLLGPGGKPSAVFERMCNWLFYYIDQCCTVSEVRDTHCVEPVKYAWLRVQIGMSPQDAPWIQSILKSYYDFACIPYRLETDYYGNQAAVLDAQGFLHLHVFEAIADPNEAFDDWTKYLSLLDSRASGLFPKPLPRSCFPASGDFALKRSLEAFKYQAALAMDWERKVAESQRTIASPSSSYGAGNGTWYDTSSWTSNGGSSTGGERLWGQIEEIAKHAVLETSKTDALGASSDEERALQGLSTLTVSNCRCSQSAGPPDNSSSMPTFLDGLRKVNPGVQEIQTRLEERERQFWARTKELAEDAGIHLLPPRPVTISSDLANSRGAPTSRARALRYC
ncbi:hypothetical protein NM688_g5977 [Phlebia brevispora]|uniref:Uncharacterized protein n=1 Tax=Phlebia brevispora TaxID=194682 RepID=A0ACC1SLN7_9APHY|nr:hypothetical protein NM688_g5977 [Phlebia brevispora]